MPQFSPDLASFGDSAGYGAYDVGHAREHIQFVQILAMQTPAIVIPDFDLLSFLTAGQNRRSMLESHMEAHNILRQVSGVQGVDLTEFNLDDQNDFYSFTAYHQTEHQQLRQFFGVT
jgi:hypothetical protein